MTEIAMREALKRGLDEALETDPNVFIMGEDIGEYGGAYSVTDGFLKKYGPKRIKDTPISENAFVGAGIGAAAGGLRPIIEIMSISFSGAEREEMEERGEVHPRLFEKAVHPEFQHMLSLLSSGDSEEREGGKGDAGDISCSVPPSTGGGN